MPTRAFDTGGVLKTTIGSLPHQAQHQSSGSDALGGVIDANARLALMLNGVAVGARRTLNIITGANISAEIVDNSVNERVDLTFTGSSGTAELGGTLTTSGLVYASGKATVGSGDTITGPVARVDETQLWLAFRVQPSFGSAAGSTRTDPGLFCFADNVSNRMEVYWNNTSKRFETYRATVGTGAAHSFSGAVFSAAASVTVIAQFTATAQKVSVNGAAFTENAAAGNVPTLAASVFHLGERNPAGLTSREWEGDILWVAAGVGSLTDANAATIHGFGDTDPTLSALPATPTFLWAAVSDSYVYPA